MPITPLGGTLIDRVVPPALAAAERRRAAELPQLPISSFTLSDLYLIAVGAYSPLQGFLGQADYESVLERMSLIHAVPWPIPITLPVSTEQAARITVGEEVALIAPDGVVAGLLLVNEIFAWDPVREAEAVYRTTDRAHPGVARLDRLGELLVGGPIRYLYPHDISGFPADNLTPAATRAAFARHGWNSVVAFQTRNPVHRAHEYLQKCALETVDGLLLHPLVGETKSDDVPAHVRMESYRVLLDAYYPRGRVLLAALPAAMRYAGPREAVFHALVRRNYGCTHFIVGRDHAGVGNFYGSYDAQRIFERLDPQHLGIVPLNFEHAFFCTSCGQMVSPKTCPHEPSDHVVLSGTRVRELLVAGQRPPSEFSRPEVADVLVRAYAVARPEAA